MKVKAAVIVAVAIGQVQAQQRQQGAANPFNFFGQPPVAQPVAPATPATDPFSQMMAHGHAMLAGQPPPGGTAAANPFDPFKMMNDAATQAHAHMTNMHASANAMMQQGQQAAQQMMDAGHQTMKSSNEAFANMMTTTLAPGQAGPISRSCPITTECFGDSVPGMSCSGVQGGATCVGGKLFPMPQSGICSCSDATQVCSVRPTPTAFSNMQCTAPNAAYKGPNATALGGPVVMSAPVPAAQGTQTAAAADAKPASCSGRCDTHYDPSFPCQCNDDCFDHNNCCSDKGLCGLTTTVATAAVVIGGTSPPNPLSTTVQSNAYDWVPGFAATTAPANSRLYDANMEVDVPTTGPSSKMLMAVTICMLTYATMIFAVLRGVSFVRRSMSGQSIDFMDTDGLDAELALEGPVE